VCSCWFFVCSLCVSLVSGKRQKVLYVVSDWSKLMGDSVYFLQRMREGSLCPCPIALLRSGQLLVHLYWPAKTLLKV